MNKSRTLILKTSLCGLALSSLFLLNNKSVVHADAVSDSNNQNNAISWNSDSDAAQNVQNTQKADDDQQNVTQTVQSYAETSTVRSSSAAPRTTNQTAAVQSPKISNINDAQAAVPVVIHNPAYNNVHVHYVDRNGNDVDYGSYDYAIDVTKTGQGSYSVPYGYNLNNPDGKYNVNGGTFNAATLKGNLEHSDAAYTYRIGNTPLAEFTSNPASINGPIGSHNKNIDEDLSNVMVSNPDTFSTKAYYLVIDDDNNEFSKYKPYKRSKTVANLIKAAFQNNLLDQYDGSGPLADDGTAHISIGKADAYISIQNVNNPGSDVYTDQGGATIHESSTLGYDFLTTGSYGDSSDVLQQALKPYEDGTLNDGVLNTKYGIAYIPIKVNTYTPAYDVQHLPVAFVDSNNNVVGMVQNYSGKAGTTQNVSLTVPTGYKLADGVSLPTSITFQNSTDPLLIRVVPSGETQRITNPYRNTINVKFVDQESGQQVGSSAIDLAKVQNGTNYYNVPKGYGADSGTYDISASISTEYNGLTARNITGSNADNSNPLAVELDLSNDTIKSLYDYFGQDADIHMSMNVSGPYDPETVYLFNSNSSSGRTLTVSDSDSGPTWERELYRAVVTRSDSFLGYSWSLSPDTKQVVSSHTFTDNYHTISDGTVTVPVHKTNSFSFADDSGNVQSVSGNIVNVTLTKPQSVNPAMDTRCQAQATRTIQINFPDGQIPEAYDGIVDKSGKLVQTVHFTRTATEDALTGNILQYGNWTSDNQDHNFIGFEARTLPRIPGYTLSIKPA